MSREGRKLVGIEALGAELYSDLLQLRKREPVIALDSLQGGL